MNVDMWEELQGNICPDDGVDYVENIRAGFREGEAVANAILVEANGLGIPANVYGRAFCEWCPSWADELDVQEFAKHVARGVYESVQVWADEQADAFGGLFEDGEWLTEHDRLFTWEATDGLPAGVLVTWMD